MVILLREDVDSFVISEPEPLPNGCRWITRTFRRFRHMYEQPRPSSSNERNKMAQMMSRIWNPLSGGSGNGAGARVANLNRIGGGML